MELLATTFSAKNALISFNINKKNYTNLLSKIAPKQVLIMAAQCTFQHRKLYNDAVTILPAISQFKSPSIVKTQVQCFHHSMYKLRIKIRHVKSKPVAQKTSRWSFHCLGGSGAPSSYDDVEHLGLVSLVGSGIIFIYSITSFCCSFSCRY